MSYVVAVSLALFKEGQALTIRDLPPARTQARHVRPSAAAPVLSWPNARREAPLVSEAMLLI